MKKITIDGKKYEVTENLGWQGSHYAKEIQVGNEIKIAVKSNGAWRFWTVEDRLHPPGLFRNKWMPNQ